MAARKVKIKMATAGGDVYIVQARPGGSSRQTSWMTLSSKTHPDALKGMPVFRGERGRREAEKAVRLMKTFGPDWADGEYRVVLKNMVTTSRDCGCQHETTIPTKTKAKGNRMTPSRDIIPPLAGQARRPKRRSPRKARKGPVPQHAGRRDPASGGTSPASGGTSTQKTCAISTEVQTVLLSRQYFTEKEATSWIRRHGFRISKIDETQNNWRFRQHPPSNYEADSFRTIRFRPGVEAVIGCPTPSGSSRPAVQRGTPKRTTPSGTTKGTASVRKRPSSRPKRTKTS